MSVLGRLHWVDKEKLTNFILACQVERTCMHCREIFYSPKKIQDTETGGFADRPGDLPDPFHTLFGVAGLGLLGEEKVKKVSRIQNPGFTSISTGESSVLHASVCAGQTWSQTSRTRVAFAYSRLNSTQTCDTHNFRGE